MRGVGTNMAEPVNLDKVLFEAPSYSHFIDVRQAPAKIFNKKQLTARDLINEVTPILKTMARDYLFLKGKYVDYQQIMGFLTYVNEELTK